MAFDIFDIRKKTPEKGFRYLFDTNVWLAILDSTFTKKELIPYVDFFNKIIEDDKLKDVKIAMTGLLLSEIINRIISDIHYKEFCITNIPLPGEYDHKKKVYRTSEDYKLDLESVCSSIRQYHQKLEFISDQLDQYSCKDLIKKIPIQLDINDYLLYKIAASQGLVIVTNDSDFKIEDVTVYTTQKSLLSLNPTKNA